MSYRLVAKMNDDVIFQVSMENLVMVCTYYIYIRRTSRPLVTANHEGLNKFYLDEEN